MRLNIPLLKNLTFQNDENGEGLWIGTDQFCEFLKKNHTATDTIKEIRKHNIEKEFKGHKSGTKIIGNQTTASFSSILRYIFHHIDQLNVCKVIASQIEQSLIKPNETFNSSIKEIYDIVCKTETKSSQLDFHLLSQLNIDDENIPTLFKDHRKDYSHLEWQKICFFEYHFSESYKDDLHKSYEELVKLRWDFFNILLETKRISKEIEKVSKATIKHRGERKETADEWFQIHIEAEKIHKPELLEEHILNYVNESGEKFSRVACVGCVRACTHPPSIHVFIELKQTEICLPDIVSLITHFLQDNHETNCYQIVFCIPGAFSKFISAENRLERFHLRDAVLNKKFRSEIFHCWQLNEQLYNISNQTEEKCNRCFNQDVPKPLHWKDFNHINEWLLDVPLIVQALLETFINSASLKKSHDVQSFLKAKILKLYSLYDALLNTSNRNYTGVYQDVSTQDLAMNYQSIRTVFAITSAAGATLSLREAEDRMKEKANGDLCYYNTYLRKHRIEYETDAGKKIGHVSLRECFLILMLDNLVRLKYHADPNPGESRSQQMCTLPITLKGVPKDSVEVLQWHDDEICDGTERCLCKEERVLTKNDVTKMVLSLLPAEEDCMKNFQMMCNWGLKAIWNAIYKDAMWEQVVRMIKQNHNKELELETSFASLSVTTDETDTHKIQSVDKIHNDEIKNMSENNDKRGIKDYLSDDSDELDEDNENLERLLQSAQGFELEQLFEEELENFEEDFFKPLEESIEESGNLSCEEMSLDASLSSLSLSTAMETHDKSMSDNLSNMEQTDEDIQQQCTTHIGLLNSLFQKYRSPPLITRHPPPATGRDDDINKLREVLDDIMVKSDSLGKQHLETKILFAPDHKIGKNLLNLIENPKYHIFLPEFPILHLRKSKINNLCSAYKNAGILHILKYMRDEDFDEWNKLISAEHIEKASRYIRRLSLALHTAFMIAYMQTLPVEEATNLMLHLRSRIDIDQCLIEGFDLFLEKGRSNNATFALHFEIMQHCDEISALAFAERLGGKQGYNLMLAAVKTSLPFSYLNGATSYAAYCTRLLFEHYKCGPFYQNLKSSLFTTTHRGSNINFGLDTQREMDHKDVLKGFRSGATVSSVLPRMALVDSMIDAHQTRVKNFSCIEESIFEQFDDELGLALNETDVNYIKRLTFLFITRGGISIKPDDSVKNMYSKATETLSRAILDSESKSVGEYLIKKYLAINGLFGCTISDMPDIAHVTGPTSLISKAKTAKGCTVRRNVIKTTQLSKSERGQKEAKRAKELLKSKKELDCMSSEMNACQAIVKPDCSKPKVLKSQGIQRALVESLVRCHQGLLCPEPVNSMQAKDILSENNLIFLGCKSIPAAVTASIKIITVEFAGVKFKSNVVSGTEYLKFVQNGILKNFISKFPLLEKIAICEEKYSFTPDDFKAATRIQRQQKKTHFHCSSQVKQRHDKCRQI